MKQHCFTIDGIKYVSGLFWQPLAAHSQSEAKKEIKLLAEELSLNLYVLRETSTKYVGLAALDDEVKSGALSVAAIVSKTLELESGARDFIFVSPVEDGGWVYVIQRDGVILPDGDQCFFDEETAKARLYEDLSLGDWSLIVAPESWRVAQSTDRDFAFILPVTGEGKKQIHKWWRLRPVDSNAIITDNKTYIIIAVVCMAVIIGGKYAYQYWADYKVDQAKRLTEVIPPPPPPPEHPWKSKPLAIDMANACMAALNQVNLFPGNWDLSLINCESGNLTVSWRPQKYGWIEHLKSVSPGAAISADASIASLTVPLSSLVTGQDEAVGLMEEKLIHLHSVAHKYDIGFSTSLSQVAFPPASEQQGDVPPPDWAELKWKADNVLLPIELISEMNNPGFRVDMMTAVWAEGKIVWTVEGVQYVKN